MRFENQPQKIRDQVNEAVRVLKAGGIVAFPTYTTYGLAVDARNEKAVRRLYRLKGRDHGMPIHVVTENLAAAKRVARFNRLASRLAGRYWPGPLTLVLPLKARGKSWNLLSAGGGTIGVRTAEHVLISMLLRACKFPITATSANTAGGPNAYSVGQIRKQFARRRLKPDFYLDGGSLTRRLPSTMVQIDGRHVTLLREGPIRFHDLLKDIHQYVSS